MTHFQKFDKSIKNFLFQRFRLPVKLAAHTILFFVLINIPMVVDVHAASILKNCPVTESSIFNTANDLYKEGKYEEAITEYKKIEKTGFESGNLYFNLGNCYFKKGKLGNAILYYEKAKKLLPRDGDLKLNFELAKSRVSGYTITLRQSFFSRVAGFLFQGLTIDELTMCVSACFIICLGIFLAWFYRLPFCAHLKPVIFILAAFFIFGCIALTEKISFIGKEAIVLKPQVYVRFEPFKKATVFFELPQGAKVEVLQKKDNWVKIERRDGKAGWTTQESLGYI